VSAWAAVLGDAAAHGGTPAQLANRLRLPTALVQAVLDHAERLGVVTVAGQGRHSCGSACPTGSATPPACAGCPLSAG
jgi:hypothetical protein